MTPDICSATLDQVFFIRLFNEQQETAMKTSVPYFESTAPDVDKTSAPLIGVPAPITLHPQLRLEAARIACSNGFDATQTEVLARFLITGAFSA